MSCEAMLARDIRLKPAPSASDIHWRENLFFLKRQGCPEAIISLEMVFCIAHGETNVVI